MKEFSKQKNLIQTYCLVLKERGVNEQEFLGSEVSPSKAQTLAHAFGMLNRMEELLEKEEIDKFNRWLGFIQGIFWNNGMYSIAELREQTRSIVG